MFDFNPTFSEQLNEMVDLRLEQQRTTQTPRTYLGASRMGVACSRALQYEYLNTRKDTDKDFSGKTLRIFDIGHTLEEMTREWLRQSGFCIVTHKNGQPLGFSVADDCIQGHVDGVILDSPVELGLSFPALWECKSMNAKNWKQTVEKGVRVSKPEYAVQIAVYQAYVAGLSEHPALFTAINKDTAELYHELVPFDAALAQEASDRAVNLLRATEAGETLPRISRDPYSFHCQYCPWRQTCWKESI